MHSGRALETPASSDSKALGQTNWEGLGRGGRNFRVAQGRRTKLRDRPHGRMDLARKHWDRLRTGPRGCWAELGLNQLGSEKSSGSVSLRLHTLGGFPPERPACFSAVPPGAVGICSWDFVILCASGHVARQNHRVLRTYSTGGGGKTINRAMLGRGVRRPEQARRGRPLTEGSWQRIRQGDLTRAGWGTAG